MILTIAIVTQTLTLMFFFTLILKIIFAFVFGMFLVGCGRKINAWGQSRIGPPVVQPLLDVLKLFSKQTLFPRLANQVFFVLSPIVVFASTLVLVLVLPVFFPDSFSSDLDLLVVIFLLLMVVTFDTVAGFSGKSIFGAIGASRELTSFIAYDIPFIISIFSIAIKVNSFDLASISAWQAINGPLMLTLPTSALVFFMVLVVKLKKSPFDMSDAHQEINAGIKTEYSGILLAFFEISYWLLTFFMLGLFVILFTGVTSNILLLVLMFIVLILVSFFNLFFARFRIDQFFKVSWTFLIALALIGLIMAMI